jgi:hypothetical protein
VLAGRKLIGHFCDPLLTFSVDQVLSREALEILAHKGVGCVVGQLRKFGRFASIALRCDQWVVGHGTVEASRPGQAAHCEAELTVNLRIGPTPTKLLTCRRSSDVLRSVKAARWRVCYQGDMATFVFRCPVTGFNVQG